jgi:hypothetical protein
MDPTAPPAHAYVEALSQYNLGATPAAFIQFFTSIVWALDVALDGLNAEEADDAPVIAAVEHARSLYVQQSQAYDAGIFSQLIS